MKNPLRFFVRFFEMDCVEKRISMEEKELEKNPAVSDERGDSRYHFQVNLGGISAL